MEKSFKFKINGIEIETDRQELTALDILKLAKEKGAIPGDPEKYILQGDKGKYNINDLVNLKEDNQFLSILAGPTPVA